MIESLILKSTRLCRISWKLEAGKHAGAFECIFQLLYRFLYEEKGW